MKTMKRLRRRPLGSLGAVALALVLGMSVVNVAEAKAEPISQPVQGAEENLGYPIGNKKLSQESSIGFDQDGRPLVFWVIAGNDEVPAIFQVVDVISQEVIFKERLPVGVNSWANSWSEVEQKVYFALTSGHMYSWSPGDTEVTAHGIPIEGEETWRLFVAPDGAVFGGTYPGGRLFEYDPQANEFRDWGQVNVGETYVRSIWANEDHVFVGSQPNGKLVRLDRETGDLTPMPLPTDMAETAEAVYDMVGTDSLLFTRVTAMGTMLVWDMESLELVDRIEGITGRVMSKPDPTGQYILFRMVNGVDPGGVYKYYLDDGHLEALEFYPNAFPGAFEFFEHPDQETYPGYTMVMTYYNGRIYTFNLENKKQTYMGEDKLEGTPNPIQTIGLGPDGKVYISGFLSPPGMARFDPASNTYELLSGAGQLEGIYSWGSDKLVMGRYPGADLLVYDTTKPWASGTNPAAPVKIGEQQDRPHQLIDLGDRVAVTSVPISGQLGGSITLWDPLTGRIETFRNIIEKQSIVSLAYDQQAGVLWGSTTIEGGYGADPLAEEAKLFRFDLETNTVTNEWAPVPGAKAINALVLRDDGVLWGIGDGTLFNFDTSSETVVRSENLFGHSSQKYGTARSLEFLNDGFLYAGEAGSIWRVDPESWETIPLVVGGAKEMIAGADGNLYYAKGARLYRWNFNSDPSPSVPTTVPLTSTQLDGDRGDNGWWRSSVDVTLEVDIPGSSTTYSKNGQSWTEYSGPVELGEEGSHKLEFRSRSPQRSLESVRSVEVMVDMTAPTIRVEEQTATSTTAGGEPNSQSVRFLVEAIDEIGANALANAVASGVKTVEYRVDEGEWTLIGTGEKVLINRSPNAQTLEVRATDYAGNIANVERQVKTETVSPPASGPGADGGDQKENPGDSILANTGSEVMVLGLLGLLALGCASVVWGYRSRTILKGKGQRL